MADMCINLVKIEGTEVDLNKLNNFINSFLTNEEDCKTMELNNVEIHCFNLHTTYNCLFFYETKYKPNEKFWIEVSKLYSNLKITLDYEEENYKLFGRYSFINGNVTFACLTQEQMNLIQFDEEKEIYSYKGFETDSWSEIHCIVFEEFYSEDFNN
jgi:hypothetical protein